MLQLDVSNAFLYGTIQEDIFMSQPQGFTDPTKPHHVCQLYKALYGLKQAPRAWYSPFSSFLISRGFILSFIDPSLFVHHSKTGLTILLIYVNDILLIGGDTNIITHLLHDFQQHFDMKNLGPLNYFLGIKASHSSNSLFLSQHKYAKDLLQWAGMDSCQHTFN